jgi:hypothetical protein
VLLVWCPLLVLVCCLVVALLCCISGLFVVELLLIFIFLHIGRASLVGLESSAKYWRTGFTARFLCFLTLALLFLFVCCCPMFPLASVVATPSTEA